MDIYSIFRDSQKTFIFYFCNNQNCKHCIMTQITTPHTPNPP